MNSSEKLAASAYLIKQAYANYLTMGGNSYSPDPVIRGLATHNLGQNTSNITTNHLADTKVMPAPAAPTPAPAPAPAAEAPDFNSLFKKYMGSSFDANSKVDQAKMKYMQGLASKGVKLNAANIYDKSQGYGKW